LFLLYTCSRSQCIINIRDVPPKCKGVINPKSNGASLTIIDLAGAEREKRTGNQVESFFPYCYDQISLILGIVQFSVLGYNLDDLLNVISFTLCCHNLVYQFYFKRFHKV